MYTHGGKKKKGFTIVELVIVILITGALVGISVLFYSNVQTQAFNTKTEDTVSRWMVALEAYQDMNQKKVATLLINDESTARTNPDSTAQGYICLGAPEDYPLIAQLPEGRCDTGLEATTNEALMRELGPSARTIEQHFDERALIAVGRHKVRGIRLEYSGHSDVLTIRYYLKGDHPCGVPGARKTNLRDLYGASWHANTECSVRVTSEVADKS